MQVLTCLIQLTSAGFEHWQALASFFRIFPDSK
jgi:hypothetical protein